MSWQDRPYYRDANDGNESLFGAFGQTLRRGYTVVHWLLFANIGVFVVCALSGGPQGPSGSPLFGAMVLVPRLAFGGQIWRIFTACFLHWDFMHILMNMVGLYFLGKPLLNDWGPRRFFKFYVLCGVLGNLFYIVLARIGWLNFDGLAAGASGAVLGLLGASARLYPRQQLFIFPLPFPIQIKTLAMVFGAWYLINLIGRGPNAGGDACHVAGLVFGWWRAMPGHGWGGRRRFRVTTAPFRRVRETVEGFVRPEPIDEAALDEILRKVHDRGVHSLTESEKRTLLAATEQKRRG